MSLRGSPAGPRPDGAVDDAGGSGSTEDTIPWPAVSFEDRHWDSADDVFLSRRRRSRHGVYRSAIPPLIAASTLAIPPSLLSDLDDATSALVRFDAEAKFRSGGALAVLLRSESASSSQIEQITASARAIAEAELTGQGSGNAALVAANVHAMLDALSDSGPITADGIERIQATILSRTSALVGWRREVVWIGSGGSTPLDADFVPPSHEHVPELIADLVSFAARRDLPVLAQAAIMHAQFETIHPFADGNGRTGRILVHRQLRHQGLAGSAVAPISAGLLVERNRYFDALSEYRSGDAKPVVSVFADAALYAAEHGRRLSERVDRIRNEWNTRLRARSDSAVWKLLDVFAEHPVGDAESVARATRLRQDNISRYFRVLTNAGILTETRHYKSNRNLYRAPEILAALDDYSRGFGRRH